MTIAAIVTAAGSGTRLGAAVPKALVAPGGESLVARAVRAVVSAVDGAGTPVSQVIVTAPADHLDDVVAEVAGIAGDGQVVTVVVGGSTRQESVAAGLAVLLDDVTTVLVHDAARAFAPAAMITRVLDAVAAGHRSVIPVLPVADTLCTVVTIGGAEVAGPTVDRSTVRAVQTPQGFERTALVTAHAVADGLAATDDAGLVAALGIPAFLVAGDESANKITTARDLAVVEALLRAGEGSTAPDGVRGASPAGTVVA